MRFVFERADVGARGARRKARLGFFVMGVVAMAVGPTAEAEACSSSSMYCDPGWLLPWFDRPLPANLPLLVMNPSRFNTLPPLPSAPDVVRVFEVRGEELAPVALTPETFGSGGWVSLRFTAPLTPGSTYRVERSNNCWTSGSVATFTAGPSRPMPTHLGTLSVSAQEDSVVGVLGGGTGSPCVDVVPAPVVHRRLLLELGEDATAWRPTLEYTVVIDDAPWRPVEHGSPWVFTGESRIPPWGVLPLRIYADCRGLDPRSRIGVPEGTHRVRIEARLLGTDFVTHTNEVVTDLRCPLAVDAGTLADAATDAETTVDAEPAIDAAPVDVEIPDAGPALDAETAVDEGAEDDRPRPEDAAPDSTAPARPPAGGCSCDAVRSPSGSRLRSLAPFVGAALALVRARRRTGRAHPAAR